MADVLLGVCSSNVMILAHCSGFSGFEIRSSDPMENISVTLRADFGTLFLSPLLMQFWDPIWGKFLVKREDNEAKSLTLEGCVDVMNLALQSIQYLGYYLLILLFTFMKSLDQ